MYRGALTDRWEGSERYTEKSLRLVLLDTFADLGYDFGTGTAFGGGNFLSDDLLAVEDV